MEKCYFVNVDKPEDVGQNSTVAKNTGENNDH